MNISWFRIGGRFAALAAIVLATAFGVGASPAHAESNIPATEWPVSSIRQSSGKYYIYAKAGETIRGTFSLAKVYGASDLRSATVNLVNPSGATVQTLSFSGTDAQGTTLSLSDVSVAADGVWELNYISGDGAPSGYMGLAWDFGTYSGVTEQKGRIWTSGHNVGQRGVPDESQPADVVSVQLFYLNRLGFVYHAIYDDYDGVDSTFVSSELGVRTSSTSCTSAYSSYGGLPTDGVASSYAWQANPACDDTNKTFLSEPDSTLPASVTLPDGTNDWLYASEIKPTELSILSYEHLAGDMSMAGTVSGSVENYRGNVVMQIDTDGDGQFSGVKDRSVVIGTTGGLVSYTWDGKDATGASVPVGTNVSFRLDADRKGEIHFTRSDAERSNGGIRINRVRGETTVDPTWLYWNDSALGTSTVCGTWTIDPMDNSVNGVDSSTGVHLWDQVGCTGAAGSNSSWGNNRIIDDWTYDSAAKAASFVLVLQPELHINKIVDKQTVGEGDVATYTVTVENRGDATIPHVVDTLPIGLEVDESSLPSDCIVEGQKISCVASEVLEIGESLQYQYKATVLPGGGDSLINNAHTFGLGDELCVDADSSATRCNSSVELRVERELAQTGNNFTLMVGVGGVLGLFGLTLASRRLF